MSDSYNDEIVEYNESIVDDADAAFEQSVVVYSRDWTVETIINQIDRGNIDLDPAFQRRKAWKDDKREKLIESLMLEYPIPEVVLAESLTEKKKYIVIDGKQRLMALHGFFHPENGAWDSPRIRKLKVRSDLNGKGIHDFDSSDERELLNSDLRCTIISNYKNDDVLYDIFYRLNSGSSPLTTQELRQVIHKGPFSKFLIEATATVIPLHRVLNLSGPDDRLKDCEIVLKFFALEFYWEIYDGNLKGFLDLSMSSFNELWLEEKIQIENSMQLFNNAVDFLIDRLGGEQYVGRKWLDQEGKWERRFNRSVFEVEVHCAAAILKQNNEDQVNRDDFTNAVRRSFGSEEFRSSVESTTKTLINHRIRFNTLYENVSKETGISVKLGLFS